MKKYILLSIILIFVTSGCDYLDVTPPNIITDEQVFSSESGALAALTQLYVALPLEDIRFDQHGGFGGEAYYLNLDILTGFALNRKGDDAAVEGFNGNMGAYWWNYETIRNVNKFIANIQESTAITQEKKDMLEAEAYAIRAWCYFAMAKRYGGVPLVDQLLEYNGPESIPFLELPRSSEKETWDFILSDLDKSIETGIPKKNQDGRIGLYAVLSLKAQAAIYAASIAKYNDINWTDEKTGKLVCGIPSADANSYYQIAFDACDLIIKSGEFELAKTLSADKSENFRLLFLKPNAHKETILAKYYSFPDLAYFFDNFTVPWGRNNNPVACPTVDLLEKFEYLDGTPGTAGIPAVDSYSSEYDDRTGFFAGRDARMLGTIMIPGETFHGKFVDVKYGEIDANGREQTASRYRGIYGMGSDTQTPSAMFRKKHLDDSKDHSLTDADSEQPYIAMRYAEVLLMAAEAKVELGDAPAAVPYINEIRTRAGLTELTSVTLDEVRHQYICELVYENKILWNYRRWRIYDQIMGTAFRPRGLFPLLDTRTNKWVYKVNTIGKNEVIFEKRFYYNQISTDEIRKNPNLFQNFGY